MKEINFNVRAGLKSILGKDLITNDEAAVIELVKNCFDAGAKKAIVRFVNLKDSGMIVIEDDGSGMSAASIEAKWMRVGYSEKSTATQKEKRLMAGSKGIGRFSCDRLGSRLKLYSKTESMNVVSLVAIDWKKFDDDKSINFSKVAVPITEVKDFPRYDGKRLARAEGSGTTLEISGLRVSWDEERVEKIRKQLSRLINPFSNDFTQFKIFIKAPDFKIDVAIDNDLFEDLATIYVKTTIDSAGSVERLLNDKSTVARHDKIPPSDESRLLRNTTITIYYLDQSGKYRFTKRMGVQPVRYGSIFLYRNGFRILPYGDVGDDWLGIDKRHTQQYARTLGLRDIIGYVDIRVPETSGFADISSRQGLNEHGPEFKTLRKFILEQFKVLDTYAVKSWSSAEEHKKAETGAYKTVAKAISSISNPELKRFAVSNLKKIKEIGRSEKKALKVLKKANLFLKSTAQTSVETLALIHTMKIASDNINASVLNIHDVVRGSEIGSKVLKHLTKIKFEAHKILAASRLATRANFNMKVDVIEGDLIQYLDEYLQNYKGSSSKSIRILTEFNSISLHRAFSPLSVAIIADNLIDNAYKAGARNLSFSVAKAAAGVVISAKDDGRGVDRDIASSIFELGFTTTDGSGLGLYHINEIAEDLGGGARYAGKGISGRGAAFEISLAKR